MWDTLILGDYICMKCKMTSSKRNTNTWVTVEDNSKNLITGRTQWCIWVLESYIKSHAWWKSLRSQNNSFWYSVIPLPKEISDMSNRDDSKYLDIETNIWAERDFMRSRPASHSKQGQPWNRTAQTTLGINRWVLKTSKDGDCTASPGSLLHCLVILMLKYFCLYPTCTCTVHLHKEHDSITLMSSLHWGLLLGPSKAPSFSRLNKPSSPASLPRTSAAALIIVSVLSWMCRRVSIPFLFWGSQNWK